MVPILKSGYKINSIVILKGCDGCWPSNDLQGARPRAPGVGEEAEGSPGRSAMDVAERPDTAVRFDSKASHHLECKKPFENKGILLYSNVSILQVNAHDGAVC